MTKQRKTRGTAPKYREDNLCRDANGRAWTSAAVKADPSMFLSIRQIAALAGKDRAYVERRLDNAAEPPGGYKLGHPVWSIASAVRAFQQTPDKTDADLAEMKPVDRYQWLKGTLLKHQLEADALRLLTAEDVATEKARQEKLIAGTLDQIPGVLLNECDLTPAQVAVVEHHLDKLKTAIGLT